MQVRARGGEEEQIDSGCGAGRQLPKEAEGCKRNLLSGPQLILILRCSGRGVAGLWDRRCSRTQPL